MFNRTRIFDVEWYADKPRVSFLKRYLQSPMNCSLPLMIQRSFNTIHINLNSDEEGLLMDCSANCRNEIRRGNREGISYHFNIANDEDLQFFSQIIRVTSGGTFNTSYLKNPQATMSSVYIGEVRVASHLYLCNESARRVRLIYSVHLDPSKFPNQEVNVGRRIGIANRSLHYQDFKFFKKDGYEVYDFGGLGSDSELKTKRINDFKRSFGGIQKTEYNYIPVAFFILETIKRLLKPKSPAIVKLI